MININAVLDAVSVLEQTLKMQPSDWSNNLTRLNSYLPYTQPNASVLAKSLGTSPTSETINGLLTSLQTIREAYYDDPEKGDAKLKESVVEAHKIAAKSAFSYVTTAEAKANEDKWHRQVKTLTDNLNTLNTLKVSPDFLCAENQSPRELHQQLADTIGPIPYVNMLDNPHPAIAAECCFHLIDPQISTAKEWADRTLGFLEKADISAGNLATDGRTTQDVEHQLGQSASPEVYLRYLLAKHDVSVTKIANPASPHPSPALPIEQPVTYVIEAYDGKRAVQAATIAKIAAAFSKSGLNRAEIADGVQKPQSLHQLGNHLQITTSAADGNEPLLEVLAAHQAAGSSKTRQR